MNMDSAYNLKESFKTKPCIDSTSLCSYGPLLLTSPSLRNILQIPGLPLLPMRLTSWPATALKLALLSSPKSSEVFNPMVTSLSSSCWTFWPQLILPAPAPTAWNPFLLGVRDTTPWSFILHLPLSLFPSLSSSGWWSCHPRFSLYPSSRYRLPLGDVLTPWLQPLCGL